MDYSELIGRVAKIHNSKSQEQRSELCMHLDATALQEIEIMKTYAKRNYRKLMDELSERQKRIALELKKRLDEYDAASPDAGREVEG